MRYLFWLFIIFVGSLQAQNSVFVLVDVSGNPLEDTYRISDEMRREAVELVKSLIQGQYNPGFNSTWDTSVISDAIIKGIINGSGKPLLDVGGALLIMPFGSRNRYQENRLKLIKKYPEDFYTNYNINYSYDDQQTFGVIARAFAGFAAFQAQINEYYLIVICGKGEDTNSLSYTQQEIKWLDWYHGAATLNSLAIFRHKARGVDFKVEISRVNISKMAGIVNPNATPNVVQPDNTDIRSLRIITPQGTREKPFSTSEKKILVSWVGMGLDSNTTFRLLITNLTTRKSSTASAGASMSKALELEPGQYKIMVSASNVSSDAQYVEIKGSSPCGNFFIIIFILLIGIGGYYIYKNFIPRRSDFGGTRIKPKDDDMFEDHANEQVNRRRKDIDEEDQNQRSVF